MGTIVITWDFSPRVRGKVTFAYFKLRCEGITPACAGKRRGSPPAASLRQDHPRVCGEKDYFSRLPENVRGSPPRVRGKVFPPVINYAKAGITPACAGKRSRPYKSASRQEDHPRVCGEKPSMDPTEPVKQGSPPRVRGKDFVHSTRFGDLGITPACAGKRHAAHHLQSFGWDHPRVCGEKPPLRSTGTWTGGSPPRVRGKGSGRTGNDDNGGITPACAGKRGASRPKKTPH